MKRIILKFLKGYKKFLSPLLPSLPVVFPVACKFYPTCSDYSREAIQKHGSIRGFLLSIKRVIRCNPFNKGGVDFL